jgi:hypothetical protein
VHLLRDLDDAAQVYPDAVWPVQIADALRALIGEANRAREQALAAIPNDVRDELLRRLRNGMLVGLSDTLCAGTRPGEHKARLLLEVLRDRPADVLRFAHDLNVPPTSNQAERDLRPSKIQQKISGRLTASPAPKTATPSSATSPPPPNTASTRSPHCVMRSPANPGCPHYPPDILTDHHRTPLGRPGNNIMR